MGTTTVVSFPYHSDANYTHYSRDFSDDLVVIRIYNVNPIDTTVYWYPDQDIEFMSVSIAGSAQADQIIQFRIAQDVSEFYKFYYLNHDITGSTGFCDNFNFRGMRVAKDSPLQIYCNIDGFINVSFVIRKLGELQSANVRVCDIMDWLRGECIHADT